MRGRTLKHWVQGNQETAILVGGPGDKPGDTPAGSSISGEIVRFLGKVLAKAWRASRGHPRSMT
jgi:hypothetical protein